MAQGGARAAGRGLTALASGRLRAPSLWLAGGRAWFVAGLIQESEQRRLFPWLAVAFGIGILVYFGATDGEPAFAAPLLVAGGFAVAAPFLGARPVTLAIVLALCAAFLGF
ncbi:MAG TPA: competence protein ComEC, partial [Methylobacterium sp.]